jgi:hypothetical protein
MDSPPKMVRGHTIRKQQPRSRDNTRRNTLEPHLNLGWKERVPASSVEATIERCRDSDCHRRKGRAALEKTRRGPIGYSFSEEVTAVSEWFCVSVQQLSNSGFDVLKLVQEDGAAIDSRTVSNILGFREQSICAVDRCGRGET